MPSEFYNPVLSFQTQIRALLVSSESRIRVYSQITRAQNFNFSINFRMEGFSTFSKEKSFALLSSRLESSDWLLKFLQPIRVLKSRVILQVKFST